MTFAHFFASAETRALPPDHPERTIDLMCRDLLRAALGERVDLGDERAVDAQLVSSSFKPREIYLYGAIALQRARGRIQRRAQLLDAGEKIGSTIGLAFWLGLFAVLYCVLCPLPARAAERAATGHSLWVELIPVAVALLLIAALIRLVVWRAGPWIEHEPESPTSARRWHAEGRR